MGKHGRHLRNLSNHNWFRIGTFVSASDGKGNWVFGDGTYCMRFKGKPYIQEGNHKHMDRMLEVLDMCAESKGGKIPLPSNSYMKKLNAATNKRVSVHKVASREIFVDCRLLYEMAKVLRNVKGYEVRLQGYTLSGEKAEHECIYLTGDNGDGLLMPIHCKTRAKTH